jgi:hypothetical protein
VQWLSWMPRYPGDYLVATRPPTAWGPEISDTLTHGDVFAALDSENLAPSRGSRHLIAARGNFGGNFHY